MTSTSGDFKGVIIEVLTRLEELFGLDAQRPEGTFYIVDESNQHLAYISPSYEEVWGQTTAALHQNPMSWMDAIHPRDVVRVRDAFAQRCQQGSMNVEYSIVRPDQSERRIHDTSVVLRGGRENFVIGRCQDITALRSAQRDLRRNTAVFVELLDNIDDVLWVLDEKSGRLQFVSQSFERIWGQPASHLLEDPQLWYEAVHPDDRAGLDNLFDATSQVSFADRRYRIVRPDGSVAWIDEHVFATPGDGDNAHRLAGLARDVTQAHVAEEHERQLTRLRDEKALAEAHMRSRDEVLAIVSHDLRNPLMAVGAVAHSLAKPLNDERRQRAAMTLQQAGARMTRLLDDLLDVSRMEAGKFHVEPVATVPQRLLADVLSHFAHWPDREAYELVTTTDPKCSTIEVDPFRMAQALTNLVANALKFTPKGGRIEVGICCLPNAYVLYVADTGRGVAAADREHLFDRFWQAGKGDRRGVGLGLSIVKGIVEAHHGTILCDSELGRGTRFEMVLPRSQ